MYHIQYQKHVIQEEECWNLHSCEVFEVMGKQADYEYFIPSFYSDLNYHSHASCQIKSSILQNVDLCISKCWHCPWWNSNPKEKEDSDTPTFGNLSLSHRNMRVTVVQRLLQFDSILYFPTFWSEYILIIRTLPRILQTQHTG